MNKPNYATKCKLAEIIAIATLPDATRSLFLGRSKFHSLVSNRKVVCGLLNSNWWATRLKYPNPM
ncbi:hypothetical protein [Nostoc sp.]